MANQVFIPKNELKGLYEKRKLNTYEIAGIYNCCQGTVWKRLKEYGIKCLPNGRRSLVISKSRLKDLYLRQHLSSRKIAKLYGCAYSAIDSKIRKYGFPIKTLAAAHITTFRKNFNGSQAEKAYLIGFAIGDLRVRKVYPNSETILVDCGSTKKEQINLISKLFKPYGRVWTGNPNKRGAIQIECSLNKSFDFLLKKKTLIDPWILENSRYFLAFLAGFTDAEGCIAIDSQGKAYFSLGNYNRFLLRQIRNNLIRNRIPSPKLYESRIKGRRCFDKYFHNQNYWSLRISAKVPLLALLKSIGPYLKHEEKINDMRMAVNNINLRDKRNMRR